MKFSIYRVVGYKGDENAYDGPKDYNFNEYVAFDAKYSKDEVCSQLSALAHFVGHYEFVNTVDIDESALNRKCSCEIRYTND